ncbi:MAG TPA: S8 family serine peptidase, partial [Thermoanaerobaculia bacterium]
MNRNLRITIQERAGAASGRATTYSPGQGNSDPGTNYVMPPPEDPGTNYVMPPPEDPGTNYVMPPPEDPGAGGYLPSASGGQGSSGGSGGYDTVVTVSSGDGAGGCGCGCCCGCGAAAGSQPAGSSPAPAAGGTSRSYSGFIIARLAAGLVGNSLAENLWTFAKSHQPELTGIEAALELPLTTTTTTATATTTASLRTSSPSLEALGKPAAGSAPATGGTPASPALPQPPAGVLVSRPLVELRDRECGEPLERSACLAQIRSLETSAATSPFPPLHSLTAYWRIDLRQHPDLVDEVLKRLSTLPEVDLAYRELSATDPNVTTTVAGQLFAEDQGYLDDAPVGISASWAWKSLAGTTAKLTVCDLEQGWILGHQDLKDSTGNWIVRDSNILYGANRAPNEGSTGDHGAAVLGQLAATGQGVLGAASGPGQFLLASHYRSKNDSHPFAGTSGHVAAAIVQTLARIGGQGVQAGDILVLEVQRSLLPTEVDEADCDAIRLASGLGVIVVGAAGNGGINLDGYAVAETGRSLNRSSPQFVDSGAILVGAARAAIPHDRAPFSNYGSRLDCFGWGEAVTTCGFGDLAGTVATNFYTNVFDGTSSATPIVAGAAALVQALHKTPNGPWLDPRALRTLLSDPATGTRQGPNVAGFIGIMPDLKAIVRGSLGSVASIYMRRHVGDDGSRPAPADEISSSPDILVWKGSPPAAMSRFGEGLRANTQAPGRLIDPTDPGLIYPSDVYVRLRNRGGRADHARVQLFASPAATLITPDRWLPLGAVEVPAVAPGDILTVSPPLGPSLSSPLLPNKLDLRLSWPQSTSPLWPGSVVPPYSLLAVQVPWDPIPNVPAGLERPTILPPGPPYFDWAEARSFLRGPGVTWRNAYPIKTGSAVTNLAFLIAGTPDQARHFDLEVIQRLPAGAAVTLTVPDALAAKLRQRQPALMGAKPLSVPSQPRTAIRGVQLAAGASSPAAFTITAGNSPLATGHSLAIRQLWKGEEVGRITWWFI